MKDFTEFVKHMKLITAKVAITIQSIQLLKHLLFRAVSCQLMGVIEQADMGLRDLF